MIRKIFSSFIVIFLFCSCSYARVGTPSFNFAINDLFNENADVSSKKDDGLSGGAVTAITLGSIAGAGILALGGLIYKKQAAKCLSEGSIRGIGELLAPVCMDENLSSEFYKRIDNHYPYLKYALSQNEIHYCPNSKYLLIYDTPIEKMKYDTNRFTIPDGTKELKITLAAEPFEKGEVEIELYLYKNSEPVLGQEEAVLNDIKQQKGLMIKSTLIDYEDKSGILVISNYAKKRIYAVAVEFIFAP